MKTLPKDIVKFIGTNFLNLIDVLNLSITEKYYNILFNDNLFWMNRVAKDYGRFGHVPKIINKKYNQKVDWKDYYKILNGTDDIQLSFISAAECGHIKTVKILLNDTRVHISSNNNKPILSAYKNNHYDIVKLILYSSRYSPSAVPIDPIQLDENCEKKKSIIICQIKELLRKYEETSEGIDIGKIFKWLSLNMWFMDDNDRFKQVVINKLHECKHIEWLYFNYNKVAKEFWWMTTSERPYITKYGRLSRAIAIK